MQNGNLNKFLWISDTHLESVDNKTLNRFFDRVKNANLPILFTGDLSNSQLNKVYIPRLLDSAKNDIYFMAGNRDYYESSISDVDNYLSSLPIKFMNKIGYQVVDDVVILGSVTWYDDKSINNIDSIDFYYIEDFRDIDWKQKYFNIVELELADFENKLNKIPDYFDKIIILSHPVLWNIMNNKWINTLNKYFINTRAGKIIENYSKSHPSKEILVLSGHTHKKGIYRKYGVISYSPLIKIGKPSLIGIVSSDLSIKWMT